MKEAFLTNCDIEAADPGVKLCPRHGRPYAIFGNSYNGKQLLVCENCDSEQGRVRNMAQNRHEVENQELIS